MVCRKGLNVQFYMIIILYFNTSVNKIEKLVRTLVVNVDDYVIAISPHAHPFVVDSNRLQVSKNQLEKKSLSDFFLLI